jgi:hypothetical protein
MFNATHPTPHFRTYATLASPVIAATDDPSEAGRAAIGFYVGTAGTVVVRKRGGSAGSDMTFTCAAGASFVGNSGVEFDQIVSGTATNVVVFWGRT